MTYDKQKYSEFVRVNTRRPTCKLVGCENLVLRNPKDDEPYLLCKDCIKYGCVHGYHEHQDLKEDERKANAARLLSDVKQKAKEEWEAFQQRQKAIAKERERKEQLEDLERNRKLYDESRGGDW